MCVCRCISVCVLLCFIVFFPADISICAGAVIVLYLRKAINIKGQALFFIYLFFYILSIQDISSE